MLVTDVRVILGYKKRRAPRSMSSRGPHSVACASSPVRVRGHRVDFPVPLGTSGCPAQLRVHDQSYVPVRTTRRPARSPAGCPSRLVRPVSAGPASVLPMATVPARFLPLELPRAILVEPFRPVDPVARIVRPPQVSLGFDHRSSGGVGEFYRPLRAPRKGIPRNLFKIFCTRSRGPCGRPGDGLVEHLWTESSARSTPCASWSHRPVEGRSLGPRNLRPAVSHPGQRRGGRPRRWATRRNSG